MIKISLVYQSIVRRYLKPDRNQQYFTLKKIVRYSGHMSALHHKTYKLAENFRSFHKPAFSAIILQKMLRAQRIKGRL